MRRVPANPEIATAVEDHIVVDDDLGAGDNCRFTVACECVGTATERDRIPDALLRTGELRRAEPLYADPQAFSTSRTVGRPVVAAGSIRRVASVLGTIVSVVTYDLVTQALSEANVLARGWKHAGVERLTGRPRQASNAGIERVDHWGDLDAIWAGGWTGGRSGPLRVWGPSGAREDMGTKFAMENFMRAYNWDYVTRAVKVSSVPGSIEVHEFDYKGINEVVYDENGVVIRSIPAIHAGDGPVSFILEWKGYRIIYAGDTAPNKWFMDYCQDADLIIYECMMTPEQLMEFYGQPAQRAMMMQTDIHTSAQAFGKIMSTLQPRHAVAYHFFNEEGTRYAIYGAIRQTYDGPLSMSEDMMVWNVTRDGIRERMAVSNDNAWDVAEIEDPAFEEFRKTHGLK